VPEVVPDLVPEVDVVDVVDAPDPEVVPPTTVTAGCRLLAISAATPTVSATVATAAAALMAAARFRYEGVSLMRRAWARVGQDDFTRASRLS
jgi:hypothetical protein